MRKKAHSDFFNNYAYNFTFVRPYCNYLFITVIFNYSTILKMKKALLLLLPAVAAALATHAQTVNYGFKGGLNLSNNTENFSHYFPSYYGGGFAEIKLNKRWALQPEILYSRTGEDYKSNGATVFKERKSYLNIPLMVKYYITPKLYVEAGPQMNILLDAQQETPGYKQNINQYFKRVTLSAGAGVGYKLPYNLGVSARYMFGVNNESKSGNLRTSGAQVGVNYTFQRKK